MQNKDPIIGSLIDDYKIEDLLGHGGMARVYRALDIKLNRYAALKVLTQPAQKSVSYEKRFYREAQSIAKLKHPNIVGVYRFNDTGNFFYMAMEYIDGADLRWILRDYIADGELIDYTSLLKIIEQISKALDYAHKHGVIHRDIKPSNIMISRAGDAILTDFGLALDLQDGTGGEIFGSPYYIAPEQAVSSAQSVSQTDFYSLGVILYEMLTGSVPYDVGSAIQIAMSHIGDPLPDPLTINPDLHPAFIPVLDKVLAKKPENRYENGTKLISALKSAVQQARRSQAEPGKSTLNKPIDRIALNLQPLPPPSKYPSAKPNTMMAREPIVEAQELTYATMDLPSEVERDNRAVAQRTHQSRLPFLITVILLVVLIGFILLSNRAEISSLFQTNTPEPANAVNTQMINTLIEGTVSTVNFAEGYMTMRVYGVNVQVSREHPLYNRVEVGDSILIEGHTIQEDESLRFDNIVRAIHNNEEIVIEEDDES